MAAAAKTKADKTGQRTAQDRIRIIQQGVVCGGLRSLRKDFQLPRGTDGFFFVLSLFLEMKPLETHPMFNPALKVVDAPQKEKKAAPVNEDKETLSFSLFEQAEKDPPVQKGTSETSGLFQILQTDVTPPCFPVSPFYSREKERAQGHP